MFDRSHRDHALASLAEPFDLVIVGGGINGCGILYAAALRGLSALLVERDDLAAGTSSRSSKLVHGGLRYLRQLQVRTTRLSCRERDRHLRLDPDLVEPVSFLYPARRDDRVKGWQVGLGLTLYDAMTAGAPHRRLAPTEIAALAPDLALDGLDRALLYRDARVDDARLTFAVAASAAAAGALVLTRCEVMEGVRDPSGVLRRLRLRDLESDATLDVEGRVLVNAAGVAVDEVRHRCGLPGRRLRPSRGSHLLLPPGRLPLDAAVSFPAADGRPVFLVPHPEGVLVGTTDLFHDGALDDPRPSRAELDYLLAAVVARFPAARLGWADVCGTFAGLRPILDHGARTPSEASRDEGIWEEQGLLSVAGGKLTTWRVTAEEAVDAALARLPRERAAATGPAATAGAPLVGRAPRDLAARLLATVAAPARLSHGVAGALARRLRALAPLALDLARNGAELAPLEEGTDLCVAEARVHFRHGMVLRLEDLLLRRTRLGTWSPRAALAIAPRLAALAREEMGWGGARFDREHERLESALAGWRPEGACG